MWPYPWTDVGTPSHLGHMDRVARTVPSQAHAGAGQEAPDIGQWEEQDVPLVRPSSCNVKRGIPSYRRYLPTYLCLRFPGPLGSCSPVCPLGALCCVSSVLGRLAPVHRCARSVCCVASAVAWATWLLFTGVVARCAVLCVRCPGPLGSCSPMNLLGALCCVSGVLGHLSFVQWCARLVCCAVCAVSRATWLLLTGVYAPCVVLRVWCPWPPGSCCPVCPIGVLCCVRSVLGHFPFCSPVCSLAVFCCVLRVRCPGPLGSCSPVCALVVLCFVCRGSLVGAHLSIGANGENSGPFGNGKLGG